MAGFVILGPDNRWSINNVGWRMIFEPVECLLAPETPEGAAVAHAVRGGLHYLDLTDNTEAARRGIGLAVISVRNDYAAKPDEWTAAFTLADFLTTTDRLIAHLLA